MNGIHPSEASTITTVPCQQTPAVFHKKDGFYFQPSVPCLSCSVFPPIPIFPNIAPLFQYEPSFSLPVIHFSGILLVVLVSCGSAGWAAPLHQRPRVRQQNRSVFPHLSQAVYFVRKPHGQPLPLCSGAVQSWTNTEANWCKNGVCEATQRLDWHSL